MLFFCLASESHACLRVRERAPLPPRRARARRRVYFSVGNQTPLMGKIKLLLLMLGGGEALARPQPRVAHAHTLTDISPQ